MRRSPRLAVLLLLPPLLLVGCGDPMLRRGHDALGQGRYDEAISAFDDARARLPASEFPDGALASAHRARAGRLIDQGRCDAARADLRIAEGLTRPLLADRRALYDCTAKNEAADPAQRIVDLEQLIAVGEGRPEVRHALMRLLLDAGRDADAVGHVPTLERRFALTFDDHLRLIGAWERAGQPDAARPHVLKVLQVRPADLLALLKLAEIEQRRGADGDARRIYRRLTAEHPKNPVVFMRYGAFLRSIGETAAANAALSHARALQGPNEDERGSLRPLRKSKR